MEGKVTLFDANNIKIGETFARRAKQLVKQQRAFWLDDSHSAVRFAPDMEEDWEKPAPTPIKEEFAGISVTAGDTDEAIIIAIAAKRITERKLFLLHSVSFIPMAFFITIFAFAIRSDVFLAIALAGWITCYGVHGIIFTIKSGKYHSHVKGGKLAKELTEEVAMIKSRIYR